MQRVVLIIVGVLAVGVLAAGATWTSRYQPLRMDTGVYGMLVVAGGRDLPDAVEQERPGSAYPQFQNLATATVTRSKSAVHLTFPLRNDGPFAVELTHVGSPFVRGIDGVEVRMGDEHAGPVDRPFQAVTLAPGDVRTITLVLRVNDCVLSVSQNVAATAMDAPVSFAFLGFEHRAKVPFSYGFRVKGLPGCL